MPHPNPVVKTYTFGAWKVTPGDPLEDGRDVGPRGEPGYCLHWYVEGPKGASASLEFAMDTGTCSDDAETPIPPSVMKRLDALTVRLTTERVW